MTGAFRRLCGYFTALSIALSIAAPAFAEECSVCGENVTVTADVSAPDIEDSSPDTARGITIDPEDPEVLRYFAAEPAETEPVETEPEETESEETEPQETVPEETQSLEQSGLVYEEPYVYSDDSDVAPCSEFPLFSQLDYPNKRFGNGTVATSGCGITSLAMVATYLTGHTYYPDELAGYFGGYGENNVQRLEYGAQQLRLPIHRADNVREVFAALRSGDVAIILMNHLSIFTETQHFLVLTGINEETGKIMVHDSYPPNYEKWDLKRGFVEGFEEKDLMLGYHGGWIFDVDSMSSDPFIYREEKPNVEPRYPGVELTWEEQQLLAKLIWLEARGESAEGQQAVAEVVLNRLVSDKFPNNLRDLIYGEGQFRTAKFLDKAEAWQAQYDAIDDALSGPYILPMDVMFFATYPENDRVWGKIGGHIFCYGW